MTSVPDDLRPLRAWLDAHPSPVEKAHEPRGGEVTTRLDGSRSMTMPYPHYLPPITDFWAALADVTGWDVAHTSDYQSVVARWRTEHGGGPLTPARLAQMDRVTLLNAIRSIDRGERFSDGLWASAWRDGLFHAAARALLAFG